MLTKRILSAFAFAMIGFSIAHVAFSQDEIKAKASQIKSKGQKLKKDATKEVQDLKNNKKRRKNIVELAKEAAINNLFPSWPVPSFNMSLDPLAGFEMRSYSTEGRTTEVAKTELGLYGSMTGIPLDPNNPGFVAGAGIGGTFGAQAEGTTTDSVAETEVAGNTYKRYWGHMSMTFLYNQFKDTLTVKRGLIDISGDNPTVSSNGMTNDFGILIYSWISGHYTLDINEVRISSQDEPYLEEVDHWFHARFFTTALKAYFDLGPGFSDVTQTAGDTVNKQFTTYFLANAGMNPFWKLVAKARAKYVLEASDETIFTGDFQYPDQALNEPMDSGIPADSLIASGFLGFDNIFSGFGVGYQVNLSILNMNEKNNTKKITTRQQGLTMAYTAHY